MTREYEGGGRRMERDEKKEWKNRDRTKEGNRYGAISTNAISFFFLSFIPPIFISFLETRRGNRVLPIPSSFLELVQPLCETRRLANGYCSVLGQTETPSSFESNCSISPFRWRDLEEFFATRRNYHLVSQLSIFFPCINDRI